MSKLYLQGKIGKLEIRNRLIMTPMHLGYCPGGEASEQLIEFYRLRAKGGVGLIIAGAVGIDPIRVNTHNLMSLYDDRFIPSYRKLTDAVHAEGAKIFPQLWHGGRYQKARDFNGQTPIAPSAVFSRFSGETPRELTPEEIDDIVKYFGEGARRAKEAGFDGVELVASAGYLISQFLSASTNLREDRYGGDLKGRMTFALEVVSTVRKAVGPDFPIMVRVAGNEFVPGGNTNEEAKIFAKTLEEAGVDAINVTGGWHETLIPQVTMELPSGSYTYLARAIKEVVSVPVVACNRIDVKLAEEIIDNNEADFIGMARGFVADADIANKGKNGQYSLIRPCVGCNQGCMDNIFSGKTLNCLCNPEAGQEFQLINNAVMPVDMKSPKPEKVLVIGAGAAGLEYARVAASRGHQVTVWEENEEPGGQILLASVPPDRHDFLRLRDYLVSACQALNVTTVYGKKATAEDILAEVNTKRLDRVVLATGARSISVPIPMEEGANVVAAWDVLRKRAKTGSKVVIVGGGAVGVETALLLAEVGTISAETLRFLTLYKAEKPETLYRLLTKGSKQVTIVEMSKGIGKDIGPSSRWAMIGNLKKFNVVTIDQAKVVSIKCDGVIVEKTEGQEKIPADTVVLAIGSRSNNELYTELQAKVEKLSLIGDAVKPRKIQDAILSAYDEAIKH